MTALPNDFNNGNNENGEKNGTADASARIWPFATEREALSAMQLILDGRLQPLQRRKMWQRLQITYDYAHLFVPPLCKTLIYQSIDERHEFFNYIEALTDRKIDLAGAVDDLARHMTDGNYALRAKAAKALIRMGPNAAGATARVLGMLRSSIDDVRENALNLLAAIGKQCAEKAIPLIEQVMKARLPSDVATAGDRCLRVLRGELNAKTYLSIVKINRISPPRDYKIISLFDCPTAFSQNYRKWFPAPDFKIEAVDGIAAIQQYFANNAEIDLVIIRITDRIGFEMLNLFRRQIRYNHTSVYISVPAQNQKLAMACAPFMINGFLYDDSSSEEIIAKILTAIKNIGKH